MAWFTASSSAPDVVLGKTITPMRLRFFGLINKTYVSTETVENKEKRGMTKAAADSAVTALAADSTVSDINLADIGGGGYNVRYSKKSGTGWTEET